jgi:hypothetical protein
MWENCWNHLGWPRTVDIYQELTSVTWGTMLEYYFRFCAAMSETVGITWDSPGLLTSIKKIDVGYMGNGVGILLFSF